jgi:DNA-binding Lrp family transcriptional regulator
MDIDETDRGILYMLQQDARNTTTAEMADAVGVAASTVRNRIENMEASGVLRGYSPDIDYEAAGLDLHIYFICSAPNPDRATMATAARGVDGVIGVCEVLNGEDNIQIEAVATDTSDMARLNDDLTDIGLDVLNSKIINEHHTEPLAHFGAEAGVDESA